jgi:hypothetical protein
MRSNYSEVPTQQSVLEEAIIFFNQHILQEKKELYQDVGEVEIKAFVSNVIKFAQKEKGVGNAGEDKWKAFCTEQGLSSDLYGFENARRFSTAYSQIAKERGILKKRLHQYSGDPVYLETFHLVNLVHAVSDFANATKPRYRFGTSSSAADSLSYITDAFDSPVIHRAEKAVFSGAGDAVTGAANFATSTFNSKNVAQASEVFRQAGNAATDVAPVDVAEVELAEAASGVVNTAAKLGGDGIGRMSEMTQPLSDVMNRAFDASNNAGGEAVNAVSNTIDSGANCCEDTSWVAACCANTGSCIVQAGGMISATLNSC